MTADKIRLLSPADGSAICLQTEIQKAFAADEKTRAARDGGESFAWDDLHRVGEDYTFPEPVKFSWQRTGNAPAVIEISKCPDFAAVPHVPGLPVIPGDGVRRISVCGECAELYNFEIGTTYYWRVRCGEDVSGVYSFVTDDIAPRWILLDGCSNVRDIGGWQTEDGFRIRQGYIYRTGEYDTHMNLTEEGIRCAVEDLGIRTDLDQRGEAVGKVLHGVLEPSGVRRILLPMQGYDSIFNDCPEQRNLAEGFRIITDPANWPLAFHCWGGADRGGTLSLLIEGILGVSRKNLILDYELTSLSIWGIRTRNYEPFANMMKRLDGYVSKELPFRKNIEAFLMDIGVKREEINRLRRMMLV